MLGIDQHLVGEECPYYGCIPSKMMIRAGNALAEGRRIPGLAGWSQIRADFVPVAARVPTRQLQQMTYAPTPRSTAASKTLRQPVRNREQGPLPLAADTRISRSLGQASES